MNLMKRLSIFLFLSLHQLLLATDYSLYVGNCEYNSDMSLVTETRILRVDPDTGDRSIVSSNSQGTGPLLYGVRDLVYVGSNNIYVLGTNGLANPERREMLYRVNLTTGDRYLVAGPFVGITSQMLLCSDGNLFCLTRPDDNPDNNICKIDVGSGNVITLASGTVGSGLTYSTCYDFVEESPESVIYSTGRQINRLNPATLERTSIASYPWDSPSVGPMAYLPGKLLVILQNIDKTKQVAEMDLGNLNMSILGPDSSDLVLDSTFSANKIVSAPDNVIYFSGGRPKISAGGGDNFLAICRIDRNTGDSAVVSGPSTGSGPLLGKTAPPVIAGPVGLAVVPNTDASANRWTRW